MLSAVGSHVDSYVAMLLLFLVMALADFVMLPEASPAQATRRTDEHDECAHIHGAEQV